MQRVLVLGGTAWLGREIARKAISSGAEVCCFARGRSGAVPEGVRFVRADRSAPGAYDRLDGEWDEVIELSYEPHLVESALHALSHRARHWTLVSTVSVYRRNDEPGADETAELVDPTDLTEYADAKVAAERATTARVGEKLLIVRPGLIAGPGDPSDRFGYWMARLSRGGRAIVPAPTGRFVQAIDVDDLAAWIVTAGHTGVIGTVNAVGQSRSLAGFLCEATDIVGFTGRLETVDDARLLAEDVRYWAGPRSLPLWLPLSDSGFATRSNTAFLAAGGAIRPLGETISRVLDDEMVRGLDRPRRAGLTLDEEIEILRLAG
jgi:2'-hydroxyisoflavone reductase